MPKQQKFYSDTAPAPQKKRADRAASPGPRLGTQTPTTIPKKPGRTKALVQPVRLKPVHRIKGGRHR